jgi:hypothetical protein
VLSKVETAVFAVLAITIIAVSVIAGCSGCSDDKAKPIPPINESTNSEPRLPTNATNIKDVGNGWLTFQCEIAGRKRTFLFARYVVHYDPTGVITELHDYGVTDGDRK